MLVFRSRINAPIRKRKKRIIDNPSTVHVSINEDGSLDLTDSDVKDFRKNIH